MAEVKRGLGRGILRFSKQQSTSEVCLMLRIYGSKGTVQTHYLTLKVGYRFRVRDSFRHRV